MIERFKVALTIFFVWRSSIRTFEKSTGCDFNLQVMSYGLNSLLAWVCSHEVLQQIVVLLTWISADTIRNGPGTRKYLKVRYRSYSIVLQTNCAFRLNGLKCARISTYRFFRSICITTADAPMMISKILRSNKKLFNRYRVE